MSLSAKASQRLHMAFRPKTHRAYESMFRTFVAFCVFTKSSLIHMNIKVILSFLECLATNEYSASMIANYVSAIKASFIMKSWITPK